MILRRPYSVTPDPELGASLVVRRRKLCEYQSDVWVMN
jgi:hypothetical protein